MLIKTSHNAPPLRGVVGHRGSSTKAPENTMASFRQAYYEGADSIELDVSKTKDGKFVVMHDDSVDRTTNGTGAIKSLTLEEIQNLDAGTWNGPLHAGERAPELGEVLDWAKDKIHVTIEVKRSTAADSSGAELIGIIRDKNVSDQVSVMSFNHEFVERVEAQAPDLDTGVLLPPYSAYKGAGIGATLGLATGLTAGLLASGNPFLTAGAALLGAATGGFVGRFVGSAGARYDASHTTADNVMPNAFITTKGLVNVAHENGKGVIPYTVDSPRKQKRLLKNGVDGVITNKPFQFATPLSSDQQAVRDFEWATVALSRNPELKVRADENGIQVGSTEPNTVAALTHLLKDEVGGRPITVTGPPAGESDERSIQRRYAGIINQLPGVTGFTAPAGDSTFKIHLLSEDDKSQLEKILQPSVEDRPLDYRVHKRLRA